jgi:diguanylate cyclase (GGDEF)-like protein
MRPLEIAGHAANLMLLANSFLDIATQYQALKLVYLVLLLPVFAFSAVRARVMVPGSLISLVTYGLLARAHTGAQFDNYMWLAFAAAVTAVGMTGAMRATVLRAVRARIAADRHRDEARQLADFDALTALPNRRSFFAALDALASNGQAFDLGLIDLDGFKPVNDIYGHAAGDAVLTEVALRLGEAGKGQVHAARLGGDEFALIVEGGADATTLLALGERLCAELRRPYAFGGMTIGLSASVGFARGGEGLDAKSLLERADYALYRAKEKQRGGAVMFDARHEQEMLDFNRIDQALRTGNLEAELHVVFQPQVDVQSGRTLGFEALARWNSPILGAVRPDVFIRAAERSGMIGELTPALLKKALAAAAEWPENLRVAFNLSVYDLHSGRAIKRVCDIVRKSGIAPGRIEFEITETAMLSDLDQALNSLARLREMGARIALDDFGSGFSSFGQIHRLPLDCLKIDRSFVQELLKNAKTRKIVKTMIDLCANLNLDHVVEGVETEEQLWQLREVDARCVQGYLFARPMAVSEIEDYLEREAKVTRLFQRNRG